MCLRKLLRTHTVRNTPTICLLTILTYAGFLRFMILRFSDLKAPRLSKTYWLSSFSGGSGQLRPTLSLYPNLSSLWESLLRSGVLGDALSLVKSRASMSVIESSSLRIGLSPEENASQPTCLVSRNISWETSLYGLNIDGEGGSLWLKIFPFLGRTRLKASRMMFSHTEAGWSSSIPKMFPAFKGTISWRLKMKLNT